MTRQTRFFFALLCSFPLAATVCGCSTTVMPTRVIAIVVPAMPAPPIVPPPDPMASPLLIKVTGQPGGQPQTGTNKPVTPQDPSRQQGNARRTRGAASGATLI
jgi:hypothetical protein